MPLAGVEPARGLTPPDFESGASANSTTAAKLFLKYSKDKLSLQITGGSRLTPGEFTSLFSFPSVAIRLLYHLQGGTTMKDLIPIERIENKIYLIRGQKVMIDKDLAELYGIKPIRLREQVKRNPKRFPVDFMFQLNQQETEALLSQNAIPSRRELGGHLPYAFTEHGILMLSSVLNSEKAIEVNIMIMRAFTRLRQIINRNKDLTYLFKELKHKVDRHDVEIGLIIRAIEKMIAANTKPKRKIGFVVGARG